MFFATGFITRKRLFSRTYAVSWKVPYVAGSRKTAKLPQSVCLIMTSGNFEGNEWFSSNRRLSYARRIMGSPGGKHWKSLQRNVWRGAVSPFKTSVFGQRMPHFAVILWEAEVTNVGALIVSFCGINAMKSIDKHSFLRKVDCEIYWMVSKYIVLTYQVSMSGECGLIY